MTNKEKAEFYDILAEMITAENLGNGAWRFRMDEIFVGGDNIKLEDAIKAFRIYHSGGRRV